MHLLAEERVKCLCTSGALVAEWDKYLGAISVVILNMNEQMFNSILWCIGSRLSYQKIPLVAFSAIV